MAELGVPEEMLRRVPRQARSRERLAHVLRVADRMIAEHGVGELSMIRLAMAAGVSVGSLYQYLPDKEAVLEALAVAYLERIEGVLEELIESAGQQHWEDPAGTLVETFAEIYRREPGFRALWFGRQWTEATQAADRAHKQRMAEGLRRLILAQGLLPERDWLADACWSAHVMADALMQEAFRGDSEGDPGVLRELTAAVRGYLGELGRRG
ncbi:TetR/AcrR family transcriptional regulator [Nocardia huaxiensis]|uniref:TetR/AcrR family transcriptional regulator n=1 Tax=Nocardia huaxiensis TaxID=2755382 RepID=UPI001E417F50|nr:TetR/AcrR family transcriptional regulator [Nocardia huaxiensis]UFS96416.1 TetR family transcriptional regulator [Nocardia huaxiensis]